jgi:hypothetical protein
VGEHLNGHFFDIGDRLKQSISDSRQAVILMAPFVKVSIIERLLQSLSPSVRMVVITRWHPDEISLGVSDLDVWLVVKQRDHSVLRLSANLHAKYYRCDSTCFVGSANLTASALGWSAQPNLELMVELPSDYHGLSAFEKRLMHESVVVDDQVYEQMKRLVLLFKKGISARYLDEERGSGSTTVRSDSSKRGRLWYPLFRFPGDLYSVYSGNRASFIDSSVELALEDLEALGVPRGLDEAGFRSYVGALLLHQPIIRVLDEYLVVPRRFGAVRDYLAELLHIQHNKSEAAIRWQTLMRWLLYFLPDMYGCSVPNHSEVFYRQE